jgi:hypothetical protein
VEEQGKTLMELLELEMRARYHDSTIRCADLCE